MKNLLSISAIILCVTLVVSCSCGHRRVAGDRERGHLFPVPVADILDNPQRYADRSVTVKGAVLNPVGVGKLTVFSIADSSGEITVYSSSSMAPAEGTVIKVTGRVHLLYRFGDYSLCYIKQNPTKD